MSKSLVWRNRTGKAVIVPISNFPCTLSIQSRHKGVVTASLCRGTFITVIASWNLSRRYFERKPICALSYLIVNVHASESAIVLRETQRSREKRTRSIKRVAFWKSRRPVYSRNLRSSDYAKSTQVWNSVSTGLYSCSPVLSLMAFGKVWLCWKRRL